MAEIKRKYNCNCKEFTVDVQGNYSYNEKKLRLAFEGRNGVDTAGVIRELARVITIAVQKLPDVLPF